MMFNKILQDLLLFTFMYFTFVSSECSGIYSFRPCCVGEKWDDRLQKCSRCPDRHYGVNCSLTCDIPYYGYRCSTGKCACNRISCRISTACHPMRETTRSRISTERDSVRMEEQKSSKYWALSTKPIQHHNLTETKGISIKTKTDDMEENKTTGTSKLSTKSIQLRYSTDTQEISTKTDTVIEKTSPKTSRQSTKVKRRNRRIQTSPLFTIAATTLVRNTTDVVKENNVLFPYVLGSIFLFSLLFVIAICVYKHAKLCSVLDLFSLKSKRPQNDEIHFENDYEQTDIIYVNTVNCHCYDILQEDDKFNQSMSPNGSEASYESIYLFFPPKYQDKCYENVATAI